MGFRDVQRQRAERLARWPDEKAELLARGAHLDPGQAGTHEVGGMSREAGFFAPFELSQSTAPAMGYASPGVLEAGHRRPEDFDPRQARDYLEAYYAQQSRPRQKLRGVS